MSDSSPDQFLFIIPTSDVALSPIADAALQLTALASRLSHEDRTMVNHTDGRAENVAEHSFMLSVVAPAIAEQFYSHLDAHLVARYATIHDAVEAYVGDTPTHDIDEKGLITKQELEQQGLSQLKTDYSIFPSFTKLILDYESQQQPEARFVRVVDKWMPLLIHFMEGGTTLRGYIDEDGLIENVNRRTNILHNEYPEFTELIEVQRELALHATKKLY